MPLSKAKVNSDMLLFSDVLGGFEVLQRVSHIDRVEIMCDLV